MAAYVGRVFDAQAQRETRCFGRGALAEAFDRELDSEILVCLVLSFSAQPVAEQAAGGELPRARAAVEVEGKGRRGKPLPTSGAVARIRVREVTSQATELRNIHAQRGFGHPVVVPAIDVLAFQPDFQGPAAQRTERDREIVGAIYVTARGGGGRVQVVTDDGETKVVTRAIGQTERPGRKTMCDRLIGIRVLVRQTERERVAGSKGQAPRQPFVARVLHPEELLRSSVRGRDEVEPEASRQRQERDRKSEREGVALVGRGRVLVQEHACPAQLCAGHEAQVGWVDHQRRRVVVAHRAAPQRRQPRGLIRGELSARPARGEQAQAKQQAAGRDVRRPPIVERHQTMPRAFATAMISGSRSASSSLSFTGKKREAVPFRGKCRYAVGKWLVISLTNR